ncbi:hypothetical protein ACQW02_11955 [Humitalea sp. 24SJ18S-53]|uniref:hypothetical protein n=1 Tax=Humitalea sp. 24SJ18S-53 TaxID=3422307 RepID=UPI003D671876
MPNTTADPRTATTASVPPLSGGLSTDHPKPTVQVPLHGKHGEGRFMTLDAEDWALAEAEWGAVWTLVPNGHGRDYVSSGRHSLGTLADQPGSGDTSRLSRLLMDASRGEVVVFHDGNPLNLCRGNLRVLGKSRAAKWRQERAEHQAEADRTH